MAALLGQPYGKDHQPPYFCCVVSEPSFIPRDQTVNSRAEQKATMYGKWVMVPLPKIQDHEKLRNDRDRSLSWPERRRLASHTNSAFP